MFIVIRKRTLFTAGSLFLIVLVALTAYFVLSKGSPSLSVVRYDEEKKFIKWVDFNVPSEVLEKTLALDIKSYNTDHRLSWIELLAYLATKYGGNFKHFKDEDLNKVVLKLKEGTPMSDICKDMKYYPYFLEAYQTILGNFVGEFQIEIDDPEKPGSKKLVTKYGLKAFSPIAKGYGFSHYDDFGTDRSFGYQRRHLGNDLMGNVGTPIIAVESGYVEAMGWNKYGGWRIGIRSFDGRRYYYYAHLRRNHPYNNTLAEGQIVKAGDVIGYMGMTGYSTTENTNNIRIPHLHFGLQLIFDESQKKGSTEIWINVYDIINLLQKNKSSVFKDEELNDYFRLYDMVDPSAPQNIEEK